MKKLIKAAKKLNRKWTDSFVTIKLILMFFSISRTSISTKVFLNFSQTYLSLPKFHYCTFMMVFVGNPLAYEQIYLLYMGLVDVSGMSQLTTLSSMSD